MSQTLTHYDSIRKERLPSTAMIQAQRDFFGSHTYQRVDEEGIVTEIAEKKEIAEITEIT